MAKKHITINLDERIVNEFKLRAETEGKSYQSLINSALLSYIDQRAIETPLHDLVRGLIKDELATLTVRKEVS